MAGLPHQSGQGTIAGSHGWAQMQCRSIWEYLDKVLATNNERVILRRAKRSRRSGFLVPSATLRALEKADPWLRSESVTFLA